MQALLKPTDNLTKEGTIKDLVLWLANLVRAPVIKPANIIVKKWEKSETEGDYIKFEIFTEKHKYTICAREKVSSTYMCVSLATRAPLPGETHLRFRDIGDGKICFGTWLFALQNIVMSEMAGIDFNNSIIPSETGYNKRIAFEDVLNEFFTKEEIWPK